MRRRHVVMMVKEPVPGRVKTRLGADIGMVPAAWWVRHQTNRMIRRLNDPRWSLTLAIAPDRALRSPIWPAGPYRMGQSAGDLGDRMAGIFRALPPGPALIVGADIPGLAPLHLARAFDALGHHDAVIGPASDGGYWLIGLRRTAAIPAGLFDSVRWSTPHARSDTLATMRGLRTIQTDLLDDVDSAADLPRGGRFG